MRWLILVLMLAGPKTTLDLSPYTCQAPCQFEARVKIIPQENDRFYEITVDGDNYFTLDGGEIKEANPPTAKYIFKAPFPGEYEVKVTVFDSTTKPTYTITRKLLVT